jgi:putative transposase
MQLVEQHIISKGDPRFYRIDEMALASKNLWNLANYFVRQSFIFEGTYLNNTAVYYLVKSSDAYRALPRKISNQVLIQHDQAWTAFFEEVEAYQWHPEQFSGRPKLPKYKHKTEGRNLLVFELGAIWKAHLAHREIAVSHLGWLVETKQDSKQIKQVRIVPKADHYVIEVVYLVYGPLVAR